MTSRFKLRTLKISRMAVIAVVALVVAGVAHTASACPSCKAALAGDKGQGDLVSGYFYSILFMLSMPFAIFGSFSGYMYMLVRRARREQAEQGSQPLASQYPAAGSQPPRA